jgi:hypothetical protein
VTGEPDDAGVAAAIEAAIRGALGRAIGPDENFFDAGLTSLALVRVHAEGTRALAAPPPVTALFAHPNLRALRRHLAGGASEHVSVPGRPGARSVRRTAAARRELRHRTRAEGSA